jgi:hypothetical protein
VVIEIIAAHILPAAYTVLPAAMASPQATAQLLAIGSQESLGYTTRRQLAGGPARGWWQFEAAGVDGVLIHPRTAGPIRAALARLGYRAPYATATLQPVLEHNDILAACFARCLLWTSPVELTEPSDVVGSWSLYLSTWRPGKPRRATWEANYRGAWSRVLDTWEPDADL